jgi:hypothetical protein
MALSVNGRVATIVVDNNIIYKMQLTCNYIYNYLTSLTNIIFSYFIHPFE